MELHKDKSMIRVLVVEPDHLVRKGIISLLEGENDILIAAEAANAIEALELLKKQRVDIILTELWINDEQQSLVGRLGILSCEDKPKIIVLTASQQAQHLFDAMRLGAQGYLLKSLSPSVWKEVIRSVFFQDRPLASQVACDILREFAHQINSQTFHLTQVLSAREVEILKLVVQGQTYKEIGNDLNISPNTVKNHLQRIIDKVGVENRAQLVALATQAGLNK